MPRPMPSGGISAPASEGTGFAAGGCASSARGSAAAAAALASPAKCARRVIVDMASIVARESEDSRARNVLERLAESLVVVVEPDEQYLVVRTNLRRELSDQLLI